jgi:hypothetical protein
MATRSNIGIVNEDGSVTGIYVHWDGYPENNGKLLLNHYNTTGIVYELMDLGDLSSLNEKLNTDLPHSFNKPVEGVCVAYGRDRGETGVESRVFKNIDEYQNDGDKSGTDYQYLFENGKWIFRCHNNEWNELTARVCKCD